MVNPAMFLKLKAAKESFIMNHPKFPQFLTAVQKEALKEGTIIEFHVTTPEGKTLDSNIKLKESDLELLQELLEMK